MIKHEIQLKIRETKEKSDILFDRPMGFDAQRRCSVLSVRDLALSTGEVELPPNSVEVCRLHYLSSRNHATSASV